MLDGVDMDIERRQTSPAGTVLVSLFIEFLTSLRSV